MKRRDALLLGLAPLLARPVMAAAKQLYSLRHSPDGKLLALGGYKEVRLVDAATRQPVAELTGHQEAVRAVAWSPDGKWLLAAGGPPGKKGEVKLWDVAQRSVVRTWEGHRDCIYTAVFSPDGKNAATASYDKLIKLWDVETGKEIRTLKDHIDAIYALAFTPDGQRLISGAADRTVKVWNPATAERLYTMSEPTDGINSVAVSPGGKMVAAGGIDKTIRIWTLGEKNGTLKNSLIAHEDVILNVAWSPDGKMLASSSADKAIKLFRVPELVEIKVLPNQPDWVYVVEFAPDGKNIVAARYDGSLGNYPVGTAAVARSAQTPGTERSQA